MDSLWLNIASILTVFDITKAKGEEGRDIEPDIQWTPNFTRYVSPLMVGGSSYWAMLTLIPSHLIPFKCSIMPRSSEAEKLIRDSELI